MLGESHAVVVVEGSSAVVDSGPTAVHCSVARSQGLKIARFLLLLEKV